MRVLWFVLFVALIASSRQGPKTCIASNPFLASMEHAKPLSIEVLDKPVQNPDHCGDEWAIHGTCCKAADLLDFFSLEKLLIDTNSKYLSQAVSKIANHVHRSEEFNGFEQDSQHCWNYMKEVRGSALCSICSGRSQLFFKDDHVLVSRLTCQAAVSACQSFFISLSKILKLIHEVSEETRDKTSKGYKSLVDRLKLDLELYSPPKELIKAFELHMKQEASSAEAARSEISICSMILNVRKMPYILLLNPEGIDAVTKIELERLARKRKEKKDAINKDRDAKIKKERAKLSQQNSAHANKMKEIEQKKEFCAIKEVKKWNEQLLHTFKSFKLKSNYASVKCKTKESAKKQEKKVDEELAKEEKKIKEKAKSEKKYWEKHRSASRKLKKGKSAARLFEADSLVMMTPADNWFSSFKVDELLGVYFSFANLQTNHAYMPRQPLNCTIKFP